MRTEHGDERPIKIMEVCGTHTSSIARNGIAGMFTEGIRLVSGPGCPVCVTGGAFIDGLIEQSRKENTCVLSFGDLFKVRGAAQSFSEAKAEGGNFGVIYSPFEALVLAKDNPGVQYILAAVGFETTIPVYALILESIIEENIKNIKLATSLKRMIPAMEFICEKEEIDGFICPGHVSVIIGEDAYLPLFEQYRKPMIITGFEPEQIIDSVCSITEQIKSGEPRLLNMLTSVVKKEGNVRAFELTDRYFVPADTFWRGIGRIESSALVVKDEFSEFALGGVQETGDELPTGCRCSEVLMGRISPPDCRLFGKMCRPDNPVGACMVSQEGACGIWINNL